MTARIVFDLDGTLVDSAPDLHAIANDLLASLKEPPITLDQARSFIGHGAGAFVTHLRHARGLPDRDHERLLAAFMARYSSAVPRGHAYPGVAQALRTLAANGHMLGLCTNKPLGPTRAVLRALGFEPLFGVVLGGDSLPVQKPDPAPLHAALQALGSGPALYVGDSEVDAATAQAARVPFLLYTEGYRKRPVEDLPHTGWFSHWSELPGMVERLLARAA